MKHVLTLVRAWKATVAGTVAVLCAGCGSAGPDFQSCLDEGVCIATVEVRKYSGEIPLSPGAAFWHAEQGPAKLEIELGPQLITNPQWPDPSVKKVKVSAARTNSEIAVRLEWEDATADDGLGDNFLYTDQAAVMFPLDPSKPPPPLTMGAEQEVVNIWQWKAARQVEVNALLKSGIDAASVKSPVEDLNAEGFSTLTRQQFQNVQGQGMRTETGWQVVFKRALITPDELDRKFDRSTVMAVAIWNGGNRETNGQKGLAGWIILKFV